MSNLTSVTVTSGIPTAGTGTVSTIDNIPALWDKGSGTGGSLTQRMILDTASPGVTTPGQTTMANSLPTVLPSDFVGTFGFMKKEDVASADGDAGVAILAVQQSTPADTAGTNADYSFPQMSGGRLWVQNGGYSASATFTPAASPHSSVPAVVGGAQQFSTIGPASKNVIIDYATLEIDNATAQVTAWRLFLYSVTPPSALTDTTNWDLPSGDRASFLGQIDLGTAIDLGSTQWIEGSQAKHIIVPASANVFGYLVNLTSLTTVASAHIVTLFTSVV